MWKGLRSLASAYLFRLRNVKNKRRKSQPQPAPSIPQRVQPVPPAQPQIRYVNPPVITNLPLPTPQTWSKVVSTPPQSPMRPAQQMIPPLRRKDPLPPPIKSRSTAPKPLDKEHYPIRPSHAVASKVPNTVVGPPVPKESRPLNVGPPAVISVHPCNREKCYPINVDCAACKKFGMCSLLFHSSKHSYKVEGKMVVCDRCWENVVDVVEKGGTRLSNFQWKRC
jgi:hypothetical protein